MASSRKETYIFLSYILSCLYMFSQCYGLESSVLISHKSVHQTMNQLVSNEYEGMKQKREIGDTDTHTDVRDKPVRRRRDADDQKCQQQEDKFVKAKNNSFMYIYEFKNETKFSIALTWAGDKKGIIFVAVTEEIMMFAKQPNFYKSVDNGKTFKNISGDIKNAIIRKNNGLQKNPLDPDNVLVVTHSPNHPKGFSGLWVTTDAGVKWKFVQLECMLEGAIVFHPFKSQYMLIQDSKMKSLFVSQDWGQSWRKIHDNVVKFKWETNGKDDKTIYITYNPHQQTPNLLAQLFGGLVRVNSRSSKNQLLKTTNLGNNWLKVYDEVFTFGSQGKFLYISVVKDRKFSRLIRVSTDGGNTWQDAQLPTVTPDRFYSILDMSEKVIFMHVDNPGDTGHGTLYISDETGVKFTTSLKNNLYPNYQDLTDFYKVQSIRGVYLASQMTTDSSIHSMITFDRGGQWQPLKAPADGTCKKSGKQCNLQIVGAYSKHRHVLGELPLSSKFAPGIILVHAHVADSLQTTKPNVYVTSNGGYDWNKALDGPHHYQIADQGGLLIAIPADSQTPNVVKFSTDEGRCWHHYKFTNEEIFFTGLLTEPGNKGTTVNIWGFRKGDREWKVHTIDFTKLIDRQCGDNDYKQWVVHTEMEQGSNEEKFKGCFLGTKETLQRLKKDSWCYNGHVRDITKITDICECHKADYQCAFGYVRDKTNSCVLDLKFKGNNKKDLELCLKGKKAKQITSGYVKIPGDKCQKGSFTPTSTSYEILDIPCGKEVEKQVIKNDMNKKAQHKIDTSLFVGRVSGESKTEQLNDKEKKAHKNSTILAVMVVLVALVVVIALVIIIRRRVTSRQKPLRYTQLASDADFDAEIEQALGSTSLYEDTSDEELVLKDKNKKKKSQSYHDDSDVDMVD